MEIRGRTIDAYHHVNNAVDATDAEEGRDLAIESILREVGAEPVGLRPRPQRDRLPRRGRLRERGLLVRVISLAAECESVIVRRDRERGGSTPMTDVERAAFERAQRQ